MGTDTDTIANDTYSTNAEVVGSAPGVSLANYMLSISAGLSRAITDSTNQQQINNMTSLVGATQGITTLLSLNGRKLEFNDMMGLVQQLNARE